jgi:hypothetical protein
LSKGPFEYRWLEWGVDGETPAVERCVTDRDGLLTCTSCAHSSYCEHVRRVIDGDLDGDVFELDEFEVPISFDREMMVRVALTGQKFGAARLAYIHPVISIPGEPIHLGLLSRGEGRRVALEMLKEYLRGVVLSKPNMLRCESTGHGIEAERSLRRGSDVFLSYWTILTTRCCLYCNVSTTTSNLTPFIPTF